MALRLLRLSPWPGPAGQRQPAPDARVFTFGEGVTVTISEVRTPQHALDMGMCLVASLSEALKRPPACRHHQMKLIGAALTGLPEMLDQLSIMLAPVQDCEVVSHGTPAAYLALIAALTASIRRASPMAEGADRAMLDHMLAHWTDALRLASRATRISLPAPVMMEGRAHG